MAITGTTDATGKVTLTLPLAGAPNGYTITVTPPAGYKAPAPETTGVLADGQTISQTFQVLPAEAQDVVTVLGAGGAALAGVAVTATPV